MFTARAKIGRLNIAPLMGVVLSIVFCIMFIFSMKFVRRGGHFELFYWTHLLYIAFFALLIIHTPNFWCWFIAPGVIFVFEKAYNLFKD
jgi:ABC-type multidrug transport system permease subunit